MANEEYAKILEEIEAEGNEPDDTNTDTNDDTNTSSRTVPLATLLKEREKRQALEKELGTYKKTPEQTKGDSQDFTKMFADLEERLYDKIVSGKTTKSLQDQIKEMSTDSRFLDIYDIEDEVKNLATNSKLSARQAYAALRADKLFDGDTTQNTNNRTAPDNDDVVVKDIKAVSSNQTIRQSGKDKVTLAETSYNAMRGAGYSDEAIKGIVKGMGNNLNTEGISVFSAEELGDMFGKGKENK